MKLNLLHIITLLIIVLTSCTPHDDDPIVMEPPTFAGDSQLTISITNNTSAVLNWTSTSKNHDRFWIEKSPADAENYTILAKTDTSIHTYSDPLTTASTAYKYRIRTFKKDKAIDTSNIKTVTFTDGAFSRSGNITTTNIGQGMHTTFSNDGKYFLLLTYKYTNTNFPRPRGSSSIMEIWNAQTLTKTATITQSQEADVFAKFSTDGQFIVACGEYDNIRVYKVSDGSLARTITHASPIYRLYDATSTEKIVSRPFTKCLALDPTGTKLAAVSDNDEMVVYDLLTGAKESSVAITLKGSSTGTTNSYRVGISCIEFLGTNLIIAGADRLVDAGAGTGYSYNIVNYSSQQLVKAIRSDLGSTPFVDVSSDSKKIILSPRQASVGNIYTNSNPTLVPYQYLDAATGSVIKQLGFPYYNYGLSRIYFSKNNLFAYGFFDNVSIAYTSTKKSFLASFDLSTGAIISSIDINDTQVYSTSYCKNTGQHLTVASSGKVELFNTTSVWTVS